jgi:uridine kinase
MFLIGIAGGSGSGRIFFAKVVFPEVALLHQDSYYLATPPPDLKVHGEPNFDHPDAFDWHLLREHFARLKAGEQLAVPVYDYSTNRRTSDTERVGPCKAIILEGIYALWDAELRNLCDVKMFLHVDADIRFIRRLHRDVRERGRTLDSIIRQYYDTVRPMHREYLESTKQYADIVVGEESDVAAEVMAARIRQILNNNPSEDTYF